MQDFCSSSLACSGALFLCAVLTFAAPLAIPWVGRRLEWFLLAMGLATATLSWAWSETLVLEALLRPMKFCGAVLFGSLVFSFTHDNVRDSARAAMARFGPGVAVGVSVAALGLASAFLTSAIATLMLVELLKAARLEPERRAYAAVFACFAIGLGGALTPVGGPIAAVVLGKLAGASYETGASYLAELLGPWILPSIAALAAAAGYLCAKPSAAAPEEGAEDPLSLWMILVLCGRMYVFTAGLILLGAGLVPMIDRFLLRASPWALFWLNSVSAVADGATLASVEISPRMSQAQLRYILLGILTASGGLIQGNAHNLVAAHKLSIDSRLWARVGLPIAGLLMLFCFVSLLLAESFA